MSDTTTSNASSTRCADCGNPVGDAYYSNVPGIGDMCIGCHSRRFTRAGMTSEMDADDTPASDDKLIDDRIKAWREAEFGEEEETPTELLCAAEDELRKLRVSVAELSQALTFCGVDPETFAATPAPRPERRKSLMEYPEFVKLNAILHRLWTASVGSPGYVKEEWRELEASIERMAAGHAQQQPTGGA